jgi:hypothetical protein
MNISQQLLACLATACLSFAALAQEDPPESPPLYQVEVLVFTHLDQSSTSAEIPRLAEPQIEDVLDQQLPQMDSDRAEPVSEPDDPATELFWSQAPEDELNMDADAARLQRLQAYDLLAHLAWVQAAEDVAVAEEVDAVELSAGAGISGTLKLYRKNYLHLALKLALGKDNGDKRQTGLFEQLLPVKKASPSIIDSRRMRLGRTVYFDQPEFGVLATVYRLETPSTE